MKKTGVKTLRENEWQVKEKLVLKKEKVYVLKNEKLHNDILAIGYRNE